RERDPSARRKFCGHDGLARGTSADEIIEDPVRDGFVKRALVSVGSQVEFERFAFDAQLRGNVFDRDLGKIHLAGDWTKRGEIRSLETDAVISFCRIWKGFQARFRG